MAQPRGEKSRQSLVDAGSMLFRRRGFGATSVDDICRATKMTKGAFFHHFASKESLAQACLAHWAQSVAGMEQEAVSKVNDPLGRAAASMDFIIKTMSAPRSLKSCLAGTTLQEVSETHAPLRKAASRCLHHASALLRCRLDEACEAAGQKADTAALANLWVATLQGTLILYNGSRDPSIFSETLGLVRQFILDSISPRKVRGD